MTLNTKDKPFVKKWKKEGIKIGRKDGMEKGRKKGFDEGYAKGRMDVVREILEQLKSNKTIQEFAQILEVDKSLVSSWLSGNVKKTTTIEKMIKSIVNSARRQALSNSYSVIAELKPIKSVLSKLECCYDMQIGESSKEYSDIAKLLKNVFGGIYIFYDSLGKAIYAGKTEKRNKRNGKSHKNSLWDEMKSAYNRVRKAQTIVHCSNGKLVKRNYYLHETACYVSAYRVDEFAIKDFESLLIRSFPNDLTNVRMEKKNKIEKLFFDEDA